MKLLSKRYEEIKQVIKKFFVSYKIKSFPLDPFIICEKLNIVLIKYSTLPTEIVMNLYYNASEDAFTFVNNGQRYIYYNDIRIPERIRFSIMHELGHILLGHLEKSEIAEQEANFFAAYSLSPTAIIDYFEPEDYMDISRRFYISEECASNRMEQYLKWKDKGRYSNYSCDEEFLPLFQEYLEGGRMSETKK